MTTTTVPRALLRGALTHFGDQVGLVDRARLDAPTPCTDERLPADASRQPTDRRHETEEYQ